MEQSYPNKLRKLKIELGQLKRDFIRYAQHEDSCGINDKSDSDRRGVCSCGLERVLYNLRKE